MAIGDVTPKDVLNFFKSADLDTVELVLEVGLDRVKERQAARAKISDNLKKARAAKGKAPAAAKPKEGEANATANEPSGNSEAGPIAAARARRAAAGQGHGHIPAIPSVPAPDYTASATSAESDTVL